MGAPSIGLPRAGPPDSAHRPTLPYVADSA